MLILPGDLGNVVYLPFHCHTTWVTIINGGFILIITKASKQNLHAESVSQDNPYHPSSSRNTYEDTEKMLHMFLVERYRWMSSLPWKSGNITCGSNKQQSDYPIKCNQNYKHFFKLASCDGTSWLPTWLSLRIIMRSHTQASAALKSRQSKPWDIKRPFPIAAGQVDCSKNQKVGKDP